MEKSSFTDLIALASDPDPAARQELSRHVTDICLNGERQLSMQEKEVAGHILVRLTREFETQLKVTLATRFAASPDAPKLLIQALALDEVEVSAPIIQQSPLLDERDLVEIILNKTHEHRLNVAMRSGITSAVSAALVQTEEPDVLKALVNNPSAEIAGAALEYLVAESQQQKDLQGPLIARSDLPPAMVQKMFTFVSNALKEEIQSRFNVDTDALDAALKSVQSEQMAGDASAAGQNTDSKAAALISKMRTTGELSLNRVISFLREKRLSLFLEGLAALSQLDARAVAGLAFEGEGQGMAVVCRAVGADRSQFATIILLLERARTGKAVPAARLQAVCQLFDTMPAERAASVVEQWRARVKATGRAA